MKCYIFSILCVLVFTLSYGQQKLSEKDQIVEMETKAHAKKNGLLSTMALNNNDVVYQRCYWEIDPAVNYIKGNIQTHFKPTTGSINQIEFDLSIALTVDSVKHHNALVSFTHNASDILTITFPSSITSGTLDSVTVYYQGIPPGTGFGSFVQTTHNSTPIVWTLSEPYGAKEWWPCKQNLNDKIDSIEIIVKVPQINRVASNGVLLSEAVVGSDKLFHWKSNYPIAAYLVAIGVTDYAFYSDFVPLQVGSLEVLNYVYPENLPLAQTQTPDIINIIKLYDSLTIEYPFANEKYGHAQFGWGGGMEHQTMSFLGDFHFSLMAHECAHQWFGDYITCGSWEDIWLNEGFASYFEGLTVERYFPADWMQWKQVRWSNITTQAGGSVLCDDTTQVGRIFDGRLTYDKGAYILHMLRWEMGDSLFFAGIKNYLNDPAIKAGYATTPDFKAHMEAVSSLDLTVFFDQWYYKQGYPSYQVIWGQNANNVSVTINQSQSHPSVSFYTMPVPIKFIGTTQDTTIVFDHTSSGQTFNATLNFPIVSVQFDPELWVLSGFNSVASLEELNNQTLPVRLYPNPSSDFIYLCGFPPTVEVQKIEILDVLGRSIYVNDQTYRHINKLLIDTQSIDKGTYSIVVRTNKGNKCLRFVKGSN